MDQPHFLRGTGPGGAFVGPPGDFAPAPWGLCGSGSGPCGGSRDVPSPDSRSCSRPGPASTTGTPKTRRRIGDRTPAGRGAAQHHGRAPGRPDQAMVRGRIPGWVTAADVSQVGGLRRDSSKKARSLSLRAFAYGGPALHSASWPKGKSPPRRRPGAPQRQPRIKGSILPGNGGSIPTGREGAGPDELVSA